MMRDVQKYHITKKLQERQVLKFDVRNLDPCRQLRNRREDTSESANQDCIIDALGPIRTRKQASEKRKNKRKLNGASKARGTKKRTQKLKGATEKCFGRDAKN